MMVTTEAEVPAPRSSSVSRRHITTVQVPDDLNDLDFPLPGVELRASNVVPGTGRVTRVIRITEGPGITDYVTHEPDFAYSTYGIHVGQDDRLTFLGEGQAIQVHLIDCREESPSLGNEITIGLTTSPYRVLTIPRGVAHTLDGLPGVLTRDEPVWYADSNPDWNIDNDLVSFPRTSSAAPVVKTNRHRLPVASHLLMSRMSQRATAAVRGAYANRYRFTVGGRATYVMIRPDWQAAESPAESSSFIRRNNFALTGPESFTITPSNASCTSDVVEMDLSRPDDRFIKHDCSRRRLTWLAGGTGASVETIDAAGEHRTIALSDPTIGVHIPPGTWYRIAGQGRTWLRCELEYLDLDMSQLEHPLNRDTIVAAGSAPLLSRPEQDSDRYFPGPAMHAIARMEAAALSRTR